MATVDLLWQTNSPPEDTLPFLSVAEGTGVQTSIPVTISISQAQATDTTIVLGVEQIRSFTPSLGRFAHQTRPALTAGSVDEQYDVARLVVVIPAGQTSVTVNWDISADNQDEWDEWANVYIASVSDGHAIAAGDERGVQQRTGDHPVNYSYTNLGFNTLHIVDDDVSNGTSIRSAGNDAFTVPEGNTQPIFAGAGLDSIFGSSGDDVILAHDGDDVVDARGGNDAVHLGDGADQGWGRTGNDVIFGGLGADLLHGQEGADVLWGDGPTDSAGADTINGGQGNDTILGQDGDDILNGGADSDAIAGGTGNDTALGEDGADVILGGSGADVLAGGNGGDLFVFNVGDNGDIVIDFNAGGIRDGFDLRGYFDAAGYGGIDPRGAGLMQVLQNGADTDIVLNGALMVRLQNVVAAAVDDTYFLFQ